MTDTGTPGYDYDLVVIGGGSGGLACSKAAAELGARVAVLDFVKPTPLGTSWGLGGTCVNVGCIPKKLMHTAALLGEARHDAVSYGWEPAGPKHSWKDLVNAVQDHIASINFGYRTELRDKGVTYLNALGSFVDAHTLECVDRRNKRTKITSAAFVIAVGGRPRALGIPGEHLAITSDDIFSLAGDPGKTLCIGASYVSLECAGFLTGIGFDVTVMVRSIILRGFDEECAGMIHKHMAAKGTKFLTSSVPVSIVEVEGGRKRVTFRNVDTGVEASEEFDTVLSAIGRNADVEGLSLPAAGVELGKDGKLHCEHERTNVPNIYAIGDVLSGRPELTPVAIKAGRLLAARLYGGGTQQMDYHLVPTTVFTPLEYGTVGLSEEAALAKYGEDNIETYLSSFMPLEWKVPEGRSHDRAYAKLICDKSDSLRVVGLHILGPNAGEITQGFALGLKLGATYDAFCDVIGIHPTTAEEFTTLSITRSSGASTEKAGC